MSFKIKICGVTNSTDAKLVADAGADAIGLNFFPGSKRFVKPSNARELVKQLPSTVKRVGVFVNADYETLALIAEEMELDFVQLHGDETPDFLSKIKHTPVIKAFRCRAGLQPVADYLEQCERPPAAVLVDAYDPNEYGGTGKALHWPDVANAKDLLGDVPLLLAGGLTPENVATAIHEAQPFGVDTASGVESEAPGHKDADLVKAFVSNARTAFSA